MKALTQSRDHRINASNFLIELSVGEYVFASPSAGSANHRFSTDQYFQTACYAAVYNALQQIVVPEDRTFEIGVCPLRCSFDDIFSGDVVVLTVHMPWAHQAQISLNQLTADLHRHGYVFADTPTSVSPARLNVVQANFQDARAAGKLRLRKVPQSLASDAVIEKFLAKRVSCPNDPVLRFFYHYQMIERILDRELTGYAQNMVQVLSGPNLTGPRIVDAFHELKEGLSEKARLRTLFTGDAAQAVRTSPTLSHLNSFLQGCSLDAGSDYMDSFYKARNVVFHAWWSIQDNLLPTFESVVAGVENDVPELILGYPN